MPLSHRPQVYTHLRCDICTHSHVASWIGFWMGWAFQIWGKNRRRECCGRWRHRWHAGWGSGSDRCTLTAGLTSQNESTPPDPKYAEISTVMPSSLLWNIKDDTWQNNQSGSENTSSIICCWHSWLWFYPYVDFTEKAPVCCGKLRLCSESKVTLWMYLNNVACSESWKQN